MNKLNSRVKRLERVKGSEDLTIVVNWNTGEPITINQNGIEKDVTPAEWETIKDDFKDATVIEVEWVE